MRPYCWPPGLACHYLHSLACLPPMRVGKVWCRAVGSPGVGASELALPSLPEAATRCARAALFGCRGEILGILLVKELIMVDKDAARTVGQIKIRTLPYLRAGGPNVRMRVGAGGRRLGIGGGADAGCHAAKRQPQPGVAHPTSVAGAMAMDVAFAAQPHPGGLPATCNNHQTPSRTAPPPHPHLTPPPLPPTYPTSQTRPPLPGPSQTPRCTTCSNCSRLGAATWQCSRSPPRRRC